MVRVSFGRRKLIGVVDRFVQEPQGLKVKDAIEVLPDPYVVPPQLRALARWVAEYYACPVGECFALMLPPKPGTATRSRLLTPNEELTVSQPRVLTPDQKRAVDAVGPSVDASSPGSFLLHGVTGSGKTEVYLQLIQRALDANRGALVLLPEIALTPQTLRRLRERFGATVAPYHSKLSQGERCAVWEAAASGRIRVVVGARSAVFIPIPDLGIIVVDEEHEPSYKADNRPRYHARDVALVRAAREKIPIVLGSATPSLETWFNARPGTALASKHVALSLPDRVGDQVLPHVEVLDRRGDDDPYQALGPALEQALAETLERGEQSIIFHNRRGFARYMQCRSCGDVVNCPNCDISLTYHLPDDRLHCHYCNHRAAVPKVCGACAAVVLHPRGTGTQRVEVSLEARFPRARLLRLDQDTTGGKQSHAEILSQFGRGDADILLGTQMVAKGLHFPSVTLVGVIDADSGLHFPDFRAHERAFQLLTQVAGRSGRGAPGRVLLQTFDPEHRVLTRAVEHDVTGFLEEELGQRQALGYPPARRLTVLTASATTEPLLEAALTHLDRAVRRLMAGSGIDVLGPARAVLGRLNRRFRGQLLLKGSLSTGGKQAVMTACQEIQSRKEFGHRLELHLDVDPLHLL